MQDKELTINNFKGVYQRVSKLDAPETFAETCKDFIFTHEGMLKIRKGYTTATLNGVAFVLTGLVGNIVNFYEFVTGRDTTSAPNEAIKYIIQTDQGNGRLYVWDESVPIWTRIDNDVTDFRDSSGVVQPCQFVNGGDGLLRIMPGDTAANIPIIWGYIGARFSNAISSNVGATSGEAGSFMTYVEATKITTPKFSDYGTLSAVTSPDHAVWSSYVAAGDDAFLASGAVTFNYKIALQYDNSQWSLPSNDKLVWKIWITAPTNASRVKLKVTLQGTTNRRITGIAFFRLRTSTEGPLLSPTLADYYLIGKVYVHDAYGNWSNPSRLLYPYSSTGYQSAVYTHSTSRLDFGDIADNDTLADNLFNNFLALIYYGGVTYTVKIDDTVSTDLATQYVTLADNTGLSALDGKTVQFKIVGGWIKNSTQYEYSFMDDINDTDLTGVVTLFDMLGYSDTSVCDNHYKYAVNIDGQLIYASSYHNGEIKRNLISYGMFNTSGLFSNDVHKITNVFTPGFIIKNMAALGKKLIIFGENKIAKGYVIPGTNVNIATEGKTFDNLGLLANRSLISIRGKCYFLASDLTVREFDGLTEPVVVSHGIQDTLDSAGATYLSSSVGFHLSQLNYYGLKVRTGVSTYEFWLYDIDRGNWVQFTWPTTFTGFITGTLAKTYGFTATGIYLLNYGSTDNGAYIYPEYKTAIVSESITNFGAFNSMILAYKSDATIEVDLFIDGSQISLDDATCEALSILGVKDIPLPIGAVGRYLQFRIKVTPTTSCSILDFDQATVRYSSVGGHSQ